ncbi:TPA: DUF2341 domain-containing protein, partial [Candidatus Micrarchaeota archaeon]|nr:DUF2341 domain-containing protein [Candidatus Micrarchaeota archaeon]
DCGDIRFTDADGNFIPYWIESGCGTNSTKIWVKVPEIPAFADTTIYMLYGNPLATSESNAEAVFDFWDDFEDLYGWTVRSTDYSVLNSVLSLDTGYVYIKLPFNLQENYMVETKVRVDSLSDYYYSGTFPEICSTYYTAGGNRNSAATILYMTRRNRGESNVAVWIGSGAVAGYDVANTVPVGWSVVAGEWYVTGVSISGPLDNSTVKVWKDGVVYATFSEVSWAKDMNYLHLGGFSSLSDYDIKDTSYDWIRVRKYVDPEPVVSLGPELRVALCFDPSYDGTWASKTFYVFFGSDADYTSFRTYFDPSSVGEFVYTVDAVADVDLYPGSAVYGISPDTNEPGDKNVSLFVSTDAPTGIQRMYCSVAVRDPVLSPTFYEFDVNSSVVSFVHPFVSEGVYVIDYNCFVFMTEQVSGSFTHTVVVPDPDVPDLDISVFGIPEYLTEQSDVDILVFVASGGSPVGGALCYLDYLSSVFVSDTNADGYAKFSITLYPDTSGVISCYKQGYHAVSYVFAISSTPPEDGGGEDGEEDEEGGEEEEEPDEEDGGAPGGGAPGGVGGGAPAPSPPEAPSEEPSQPQPPAPQQAAPVSGGGIPSNILLVVIAVLLLVILFLLSRRR